MSNEQMIELIATKVMGWTAERCAIPTCQCGAIQRFTTEAGQFVSHDWNSLTDPAASKQLREKLAELEWQCTLVHKPYDQFPEERWAFHAVRLENRDGKQRIARVCARGATEYEAVANFALKSLSPTADTAGGG